MDGSLQLRLLVSIDNEASRVVDASKRLAWALLLHRHSWARTILNYDVFCEIGYGCEPPQPPIDHRKKNHCNEQFVPRTTERLGLNGYDSYSTCVRTTHLLVALCRQQQNSRLVMQVYELGRDEQ